MSSLRSLSSRSSCGTKSAEINQSKSTGGYRHQSPQRTNGSLAAFAFGRMASLLVLFVLCVTFNQLK